MKTFFKLVVLWLLVSCKLTKNTDENKFFFQNAELFFTQYQYSKAIPYYRLYIGSADDSDSLKQLSYYRLFFCNYRLSHYKILDSLYSQIKKLNSTQPYDFRYDFLRTQAYLLASRKQYPDAISLLRIALQLSPNIPDYHSIAVFYYRINRLDSASYYFHSAIRYARQTGDTFHFRLSSIYCCLANDAYYYEGDMDKASAYFDTAQWIMQHCAAVDSDYYAWNLHSLGVFMQSKGYISRAAELYEKAYQIYSQLPGDHEMSMSALLSSQATIDNYLKRYTLALSKIDHAIQYFKDSHDIYYLTIAQMVKADILYNKGEYRQALQTYLSLLNLYNSDQLLSQEVLYYSIGLCYMNINNYDSANYWLQRSITLLSRRSAMLVNYCCVYSNFLLNAGKPFEALSVLEKNYPYVRKNFGGKNQRLIFFLNHRAKVLEKLNKYHESLATYSQIFELITNSTSGTADPFLVPHIEQPDFELANEIVEAMEGKADLISKMAGDNRTLLQSGLQHYLKAAELVESYRKNMRLEMDKILYNEFNTRISEKIFRLAIKLWQMSESPNLKDYYFQLAFNISNTLKANVLTENIVENSLKQIAGIPDSVQSKERILMQDILVLQNTIRDEYRQANPNLSLIRNWQTLLVSNLKTLQEMESSLEAAYPLYRELKYQHRRTFTVKELQARLKHGENLISYHWQGKQIYLFLINKETARLIQPADTNLLQQVEQFRKKLTNPSLEKNYTEEFREYMNLAFQLYQTLIACASPYFCGNRLIIVPDRQLNYIPFEALISDTVYRAPIPDYGLLPYLIYRYNIRYAYSVHLYDLQQRNISPVAKGVWAFSPTYAWHGQEKTSKRSAIYRSQLAPLPGALEEAREVVSTIGGRVFKGKYATESQFKKHTRQGYILHLAMHTLVDDENPMYSKLAFTAENDSLNDGLLNAFEIYNLRFSTPMVVLSACNTGYGKMMQGEGLYSLARGFIYAGCPTLLFTLWQISDKPSKSLMQYFYQHIKMGEDIDHALRNAKIQYLHASNASMAHPYFWAAYCMTGKNESIQFFKGYHQRIWVSSLIIMSVCLLVLVIFYRYND